MQNPVGVWHISFALLLPLLVVVVATGGFWMQFFRETAAFIADSGGKELNFSSFSRSVLHTE